MPTTIIDYTSSLPFSFDSSKVTFDGSVAKLANNVGPEIDFFAGFHTTTNLDYSRGGGVLTGTVVDGTIINTGGFLDMTTPGKKKLRFAPLFNVSMGPIFSIRLTIKFPYAGAPAQDNEIFQQTSNQDDNTNQVRILHEGNTKLHFIVKGSISEIDLNANFSPTLNQTIEALLCVNLPAGRVTAFVNGNIFAQSTSPVQTRRNWCDLFQMGQPYVDTGSSANFFAKDLISYNTELFTSSYTPGYSLPTVFSTVAQAIEHKSPIKTPALQTFASVQTGTVTHSPIVNTVRKFWNGSAWVTAGVGQSNTAAEINTHAGVLLDSTKNNTLDFISYISSPDGITQSTLTSLTFSYTAALSLFDYPPAGDVLNTIAYQDGFLVGTFVSPTQPDPSIVKIDEVYNGGVGEYDGSDRWTNLPEGAVVLGLPFKANSTTVNKTGSLVSGITNTIRKTDLDVVDVSLDLEEVP